MRAAINVAREKLDHARAVYRKTVRKEQLNCKHLRVAQENSNAWPAGRVCLDCGIWESQSCGFLVLNAKHPVLHRDISKITTGARITDEDKGPLLRREKTVRDLIEEQF